MGKLSQLFYNSMYRFTTPDWDTGITPPEVITIIEKFDRPGRALDLGCGTGTSSIYLAQHGWQVTGVDFSPKAIDLARDKARQVGIQVDFQLNDVTRLDFLREPFNLILDVGCFHGLDQASRIRYAEQVARLTRPGSKLLLHGFMRPAIFGRYHLMPEEVQRGFEPAFVLNNERPGSECSSRDKRNQVWYDLTRQ